MKNLGLIVLITLLCYAAGVKSWLIFLLIASTITGCSTTFSFYPVEGPLSKTFPLPIVRGTAFDLYKNTGRLILRLPDSEYCEGQWSVAGGGSYSTLTYGTLFTTYGPVYTSGVTTYPTTGVIPGQAVLTCNKGTIIEVEFYTGSGVSNGFGFAKDNKGNIYKLLF